VLLLLLLFHLEPIPNEETRGVDIQQQEGDEGPLSLLLLLLLLFVGASEQGATNLT
jgi:hypothetical protein